jgi:hypothetical protein
MPAAIIKSFAEKAHKSEKEVEELWLRAKDAAEEKFPKKKDSSRKWAYATGTLKKMLNITEDIKLSFKTFINFN